VGWTNKTSFIIYVLENMITTLLLHLVITYWSSCIVALEIQDYFYATNAIHFLQPKTPLEYQWFGTSVAVSGDYAIVGSPGNFEYNSRGNAVVFERDGNDWKQTGYLEAGKGIIDDSFGVAVAIQTGYALVGAST
jgi:hypothetical protein